MIRLFRPFATLVFIMTVLLASAHAAVQTPDFEIRVAPEGFIIPTKAKEVGIGYMGTSPYYDMVMQTIFFINNGEEDLKLTSGGIEIFQGEELMQRVEIDLAEVERAQSFARMIDGMGFGLALDVQYAAFIVTDDNLGYASGLTIEPTTAALVDDYFLTIRGLPDSVRVSATAMTSSGEEVHAELTVPVRDYKTRNDYIFPVEPGNWHVLAFPGIKGHHRWTAATEHSIDITMVDERGSWARGETDDWNQGLVPQWEDWYAYGKKVLAAADGVVVKVGKDNKFPLSEWNRQAGESFPEYQGRIGKKQQELLFDQSNDPASIAGGNHVVIEHANGEFSFYAHLAYGGIEVAVGDSVKQGQHIAALGGTGEMPAVHLHFQVSDSPSLLRSRTLPVQFTNIGVNSPFGHLYHPELVFQPGIFVEVAN